MWGPGKSELLVLGSKQSPLECWHRLDFAVVCGTQEHYCNLSSVPRRIVFMAAQCLFHITEVYVCVTLYKQCEEEKALVTVGDKSNT